jgi:hypothetical protein
MYGKADFGIDHSSAFESMTSLSIKLMGKLICNINQFNMENQAF